MQCGRVGPVAVELHDEILRAPEEIHREAADRVVHTGLGKEAAEVRQRSGWSRDWDAGSPGHSAGDEGAGSMNANSLTAARIAWGGDVHRTPLGKELPQRGRTGVAEDSIGTAGERRGHPSPLLAEAAVPEGVHTAVNAVQALRGGAASPASLVDAGLLELRE